MACRRCGHAWQMHGDGLDADMHESCEFDGCDCPQYEDEEVGPQANQVEALV